MKKLFLCAGLLASLTAQASTPTLQDLSKKQVEEVANEFAMNFSHTVVSAPETSGLWGIEVGFLAGQTGSPKLSDVVDDAGEDGSDFKNIYHAGLLMRAHFPYEIFLEASLLPERKISEVNVSSRSFGLGWNFGSFFSLPLDLAIGTSLSASKIKFKQDTTFMGNPTPTTISVDSSTHTYWIGASKTFLFFTPYVKLGLIGSDSKVKSSVAGTVFGQDIAGKKSVDVDSSGNYWALGANFDFAFFKFGVETSRQSDVSRSSAKISVDF